ncbi:MAG: MBL fold metallo-hydrolase, partial [Betaproteobacteria bacterium]|nr:MBL fold metallo-hydrolase [Betaproteobacteria bacterium]
WAQTAPSLGLIQVSPSVWYVQGLSALGTPGNQNFISNAAVIVTGQGVVVVDALGSPALAQGLAEEIRLITLQPISHVIVTHYHADHIYGLQTFKALGARIWAHQDARDYLRSDTAELRLSPDILRPGHGVNALEFIGRARHPTSAWHREHGFLNCVIPVHAGDVNDLFVADKAVAGVVVDRQAVGCLAAQQCHHRGRTGLAVLIGHMARLWHRWCRQDRVAQHVDIFGNLRLMGQKINLAPALVGCGQTGLDGNIACPHGRQDIEDRGLHVVTEFEFQGVGERVDID